MNEYEILKLHEYRERELRQELVKAQQRRDARAKQKRGKSLAQRLRQFSLLQFF